MEIASAFSEMEIKFNPNYLHNTNDYTKYITSTAQAINLGIYGADLSFCCVFGQHNLTVKYFNTVKNLAQELDLMKIVNDSTLRLIEQNLDSPYVLQQIVSETFYKADAYLQEADRQREATLILTGGWVETMYLILSFLHNQNAPTNCKAYNLIADEYLVIDDLMNIIKTSPMRHPKKLLSQLQPIKYNLSKLIKFRKIPVYDSITDSTYITTVIEYQITSMKLDSLRNSVSKLRKKFINLH
jgi:hypothetical protein